MMSSSHRKKIDEFVERFIEVCDTGQPTKIAKLLNISYQAAKNYLSGRHPDSKTLLIIAEKTPYSIHWLMTGNGEKFVDQSNIGDSELFIAKFKGIADPAFLRAFLIFFDEFNGGNTHTSTDSPKTVILTPDKIREQKVEVKDSSDLPINPS